MESNSFDFKWLIGIVRENFKLFLIVGFLSAIAGVVVSLPIFMTPKFKSTAVVYPANVGVYSEESQTEQMLQYFEASSIRDSIIEKFDLYNVYEIEEGSSNSRFYILEEYRDNVRVSKTKYESILLEVISEDPELASNIADEILLQVNLKYDMLMNTRFEGIVEAYEKQMNYQRVVIDSLESLIAKISTENDVLDYGSQTRELVRGYVDVLSRSGSSGINDDLQKLLTNTQEKGSLIKMLQNLSYMATVQHSELSAKYLENKVFHEADLQFTDVIVEPEIADKKFWPVRWLVLVIVVVSSLLFTLVGILLFKKA
ncbi:MAG: Wzz/FepE/Etk N-terminal domain-containing protein [Flavobacteriales bacterium]|nr:Wzz/FepE/Etk N-terminal domain-containing protein [Flavobacteriales bacterium]